MLADTKITGESLRLIPDDPFLSSLDVSGTNIRGDEIAIISERFSRHLRVLGIARLKVTDKNLQALSSMKYLGRLDISDTLVTDAGFAALKPVLRLRVVDARRTAVTLGGARKQLGERVANFDIQVE